MSRAIYLLLVLLAAACTRAGGPDDGGRTPMAPPTSPAPAPVIAAPIASDGCAVLYETHVEPVGKGYRVSATATNRSAEPVTIAMPDRCPAGPVELAGLPAGYDAYQACARGACLGTSPTLSWTVAPGATVDLAAMEIDPAGDGCNAALPAGTYTLSFAPPEVAGLEVCGPAPVTLEHRPATKPE